MKKTLMILFVMIIAASCIALTGCGGGSSDSGSTATDEGSAVNAEYVGTWKATSAQVKDETEDIDEVLDEDFIIELKEDGTATMTSEDGVEEGKWFETKDGVRFQGADESDIEFKYSDGKLDLKVIGVHLIFEKQ